MVGKLAASMACATLVSVALLGCAALGGPEPWQEEAPTDSVAGARSGPGSPNPGAQGPLSNSDWTRVSEDPAKFTGTQVDISGEVFNVLEDADGFHRFQIYTEPGAGKGNTHIAIRDLPRQMKKGYQVRVVGTLRGTRVSRSVSGKELRIPEVEAQLVEVVGPPSVVTPTATTRPSATPTATREPTSTPTARPATATATAVPATSTPRATAGPTSTAVPPTGTAVARATATAVPATATAAPATAQATSPPTAAGTPAATPMSGEANQPVVVQASSARVRAPMAVGEDPGASGGKYLYSSASDQGWNGRGSPPATGEATLTVEVPAEGSYSVWLRVWYAGIDGNSLWMAVDQGSPVKVGNDEGGYRHWRWVGWHDGSPANRINVELSAGSHTVRLIGREAGTRVDSLLLTTDPSYVPE